MNLYALLFALIITILVFFLFRELFCWYWKINRSIELQENILKELQKINNPESNGKNHKNTFSEHKGAQKAQDLNKTPIVVDKKTGRQMEVTEITSDGKLVCSVGSGIFEEFLPDEVTPIEQA